MNDRICPVRYPDITVPLTGYDGHAFSIIGRVSFAIKEKRGIAAAREFSNRAMDCGSYDALLTFVQTQVEVT